MRLADLFRNVNYVTLKLTNGCNLSCSYCNVEALTPQTPKMSLERFRQVARLLVENSQFSQVGLEFHGGEPMLLDDEWFTAAVGYARELAARHGKQIEFPLVTNGTLLSEERLKRLMDLDIRLCVSCDGPPAINNLLRASGNAVERAIRLLLAHDVHFGIITVMSQSNYLRMREVMDWYRDIGVSDFRVNFMQPQGRGMDGALLTGEQMFAGMRQVLDHMDETRVSVHEADMASHVTRFVHGRQQDPPLSCWECECQAGRSYVAVDVFGRLHACGTDLSSHVLGHVDHDLDDDHYRKTLARLHDKGQWPIRCFDCPARRICNHSCPTSDYNSETYKEHECRYTILLWNYLCEHPEKAFRIEKILRPESPQIPAGDGRNFVPLSALVDGIAPRRTDPIETTSN